MNKNKRRNIILVLVVFVLLLLFWIFFSSPDKAEQNAAQDTGGAPYVTLKGSGVETLYNFTTYDKYRAITDRLADYVVAQGEPAKGTEIQISDVEIPTREDPTNKTTFKISIPSLDQNNLIVEVYTPPSNKNSATFTVKGTPYSVSLYTN